MLNLVFGVVTVISMGLTIHYGVKATRLEAARKRVDYSDLQSCASDLGKEISRDFSPDLCYTPGLNGATFARLLVEEVCEPHVPVYVGQTLESGHNDDRGVVNSHLITTSRWRVSVPEEIFSDVSARILIVDDFAMSGDFLQDVVKLLEDRGYTRENIRTVCVATTKVAKQSGKAPDHYWLQFENDEFYFPWGRAS